MAGQVTTFDLIVLISVAVAIQGATLAKGSINAFIFVSIVSLIHGVTTFFCRKSKVFQSIVRGTPTRLIINGTIDFEALHREGLTVEQLEAGLRKAGLAKVSQAQSAHLEETGQISAIKNENL